MDLEALRALATDLQVAVLGVDVTVTAAPFGATPVATRGIWVTPQAEPDPFGRDRARQDPRRIMAFAQADGPIERGMTVEAAERPGGTVQTWRVDGRAREDTRTTLYVFLVPVNPLTAP